MNRNLITAGIALGVVSTLYVTLPTETKAATTADVSAAQDGSVVANVKGSYLEISGKGAIAIPIPAYAFEDNIKYINIGEGITSICDDAFINSPATIQGFTIASTVTNIGSNIIPNCPSLDYILNYSLTSQTIKFNAFAGVPSGCIFSYFETNTAFKDFTLSFSYSELEKNFKLNSKYNSDEIIGTLSLPDGTMTVSGIGDMTGAEDGSNTTYEVLKRSVRKVIIGEGITRIGNSFENNLNITSVTLPSTLRVIGKEAFADNKNLNSIVIPSSVTEISGGAFSRCDNLTEVVNCSKSSQTIDASALKYASADCKYYGYASNTGFVSVVGTLTAEPIEVTATPSTTGWTSSDITYTLAAIDHTGASGALKYSMDGENWQDSNEFTITDNGEYKFYAKNENGIDGSFTVNVTSIDRTAPSIASFTSSTSSPTKSAVTLTAQASDTESGIKNYELYKDTTLLDTNTTGSFTISENGAYTVKVYDNVDNASSKNITVTNIDKTAPLIPVIVASTTAWTNEDVLLAVTSTDTESGIKSYTLLKESNVIASNETGGFTVSENGTYIIKVEDNAGNISSDNITITNIDKTAPTISILPTPTETTNETVNLTISATDTESGIAGYSLDNKTWQTSNIFTIDTNGTYTVYVKDNIGNASQKNVVISNIGKSNSIISSLKLSDTDWVDHDVMLTVTPTDDALLKYSLDNITWQESPIFTISENGKYTIYAKDTEGNISSDSINVNIIDKEAPTDITINLSPATLTNRDVNLVVSAKDTLSGVVAYSLDGENWQESNILTVTSNGDYTVHVKDRAGNSASKSVTVNNIYKVIPTCTIAKENWDKHSSTVNISNVGTRTTNIVVSDLITITPSKGKEVSDYSYTALSEGCSEVDDHPNQFVVTTNGTYSFEVTDKVGNKQTLNIDINNLKKPAPTVKYSYDKNWTSGDKEVSFTIDALEGSTLSSYYYGVSPLPTPPGVITALNTISRPYLYPAPSTDSVTITVKEDSKVSITVIDSLKNSTTVVLNITGIDKQTPINVKATLSTTAWTNQDVTATISAEDDSSGIDSYSIDGGDTWVASNVFTIKGNGKYTVKVKDKAGNIEECSFEVQNINRTCPIINSISQSSNESINKDIDITVSATDDLTLQYKLDDGEWQSKNTFTISKNGNYTVYVKDEAGNLSQDTITISEIDKAAPVIQSATQSTKDWTNKDIILTVIATDSNPLVYSIDGINWQTSSEFTVKENGKYTLRVKDSAENISLIETTINNIKKSLPTVNDVTLSETGWVNHDITCTINAMDNVPGTILSYSLDKSSWQASPEFTISENGDYVAYVKDQAGNIVNKEFTVSNISTTAPIINSLELSKEDFTNQDIVLTVNASVNTSAVYSNIAGYSLDGKVWQESNKFTISSNGMYVVYVKDEAGNISTKSITVSNILKDTPEIQSVVSSNSNWCQSLVVTVDASPANAPTDFISYDGGKTWTSSKEITVTKNKTLNICVRNKAGTVSEVVSYVISNIDTDNPVIDDIHLSETDVINQPINISITASDSTSGVSGYSIDGGETWQNSPIFTISANGKYTVLVRDKADNKASKVISISNIDTEGVDITDVAFSTEDWTRSVDVEVTTSEDSSNLKYCINDSEWQSSNKFTIISNGMYTVKVKDEASNVSSYDFTVSNIDDTAPELTYTFEDNILTWTATDSESGIPAEAYSLDGGNTWTSKTFKRVDKDTELTILVRDNVGNIAKRYCSLIASDIKLPEIPIKKDDNGFIPIPNELVDNGINEKINWVDNNGKPVSVDKDNNLIPNPGTTVIYGKDEDGVTVTQIVVKSGSVYIPPTIKIPTEIVEEYSDAIWVDDKGNKVYTDKDNNLIPNGDSLVIIGKDKGGNIVTQIVVEPEVNIGVITSIPEVPQEIDKDKITWVDNNGDILNKDSKGNLILNPGTTTIFGKDEQGKVIVETKVETKQTSSIPLPIDLTKIDNQGSVISWVDNNGKPVQQNKNGDLVPNYGSTAIYGKDAQGNIIVMVPVETTKAEPPVVLPEEFKGIDVTWVDDKGNPVYKDKNGNLIPNTDTKVIYGTDPTGKLVTQIKVDQTGNGNSLVIPESLKDSAEITWIDDKGNTVEVDANGNLIPNSDSLAIYGKAKDGRVVAKINVTALNKNTTPSVNISKAEEALDTISIPSDDKVSKTQAIIMDNPEGYYIVLPNGSITNDKDIKYIVVENGQYIFKVIDSTGEVIATKPVTIDTVDNVPVKPSFEVKDSSTIVIKSDKPNVVMKDSLGNIYTEFPLEYIVPDTSSDVVLEFVDEAGNITTSTISKTEETLEVQDENGEIISVPVNLSIIGNATNWVNTSLNISVISQVDTNDSLDNISIEIEGNNIIITDEKKFEDRDMPVQFDGSGTNDTAVEITNSDVSSSNTDSTTTSSEETPSTSSEETPSEETPSTEAPAEDEIPSEETPSEETPSTSSEETPSEETPSEETSSKETPSISSEETPSTPSEETSSTSSEETPSTSSEETSSEETPSTPSEETPSEETSSEETPSTEAPAEEEMPADEIPAGEAQEISPDEIIDILPEPLMVEDLPQASVGSITRKTLIKSVQIKENGVYNVVLNLSGKTINKDIEVKYIDLDTPTVSLVYDGDNRYSYSVSDATSGIKRVFTNTGKELSDEEGTFEDTSATILYAEDNAGNIGQMEIVRNDIIKPADPEVTPIPIPDIPSIPTPEPTPEPPASKPSRPGYIYISTDSSSDDSQEKLEQEKLEQERLEQERLEQERLEQERLEQERLEQRKQETPTIDKGELESKMPFKDFKMKLNSTSWESDGVSKISVTAPEAKDGRLCISLRMLSEALGIPNTNIKWSNKAKIAVVTLNDGRVLKLYANTNIVELNGEAIQIKGTIYMNGNRVMLPIVSILDIILEKDQYTVDWDQKTKEVSVTFKNPYKAYDPIQAPTENW